MRKDTLDCVNLLPLLLGQFCLVPSPSVPCTYPITRCLSPALTSSFLLTFTAAAESRCLFLHPRRTCACSCGSPPRPSLETRLSQQGFFLFFFPLNVWSRVVFTVVIAYKWHVVWASPLCRFSVSQTHLLSLLLKRQHTWNWHQLTAYSDVLVVPLRSGLKQWEYSNQSHAASGALSVKLLHNAQMSNLFPAMFLKQKAIIPMWAVSKSGVGVMVKLKVVFLLFVQAVVFCTPTPVACIDMLQNALNHSSLCSHQLFYCTQGDFMWL